MATSLIRPAGASHAPIAWILGCAVSQCRLSPCLQAYRVACHYGDSEEQVEESMRIASSAVYNKLMLFVLVSVERVW